MTQALYIVLFPDAIGATIGTKTGGNRDARAREDDDASVASNVDARRHGGIGA
jgi:hypothetical protein